jgi:NADPH2:quinone reductase
MTAHYLTTSVYPLKAGESGARPCRGRRRRPPLLVQQRRDSVARVIGTVGTPAKAELAHATRAPTSVIIYTESDFELETRRLTDGRGVQVVYDSVGRDAFFEEASTASRRARRCLRYHTGNRAVRSLAGSIPALLAPEGIPNPDQTKPRPLCRNP